MKIIIEPGASKNIITTIAVGKKYFQYWDNYAKPTWIKYCKKNKLGLIIFDKDLINSNHKKWKKPTWQKGLIGDILLKKKLNIENVCYLDSDILINPNSPNIFKNHNSNKISLVSHRFRLPYKYYEVLEKIAFNRHHFYNKKYPLDSSLFISLKKVYQIHNLIPQKDEACMGLFIFNLKKYSKFFKDIFFKYDKNVKSFTNDGDQTHYNYEIQHNKEVHWLDYKYQTLWLFEMAWKYPFLYQLKNKKNNLIKYCIEASLDNSYFLHFAGSWYESEMWKIKNIYTGKRSEYFQNEFNSYKLTKKTGKLVGQIKP